MSSNRKDQLKALFGMEQAPAPAARPEQPPAAPQAVTAPEKTRSSSGAVKAMGLSLGGLSRELDDARRLKESLEAGERIVELDPALVDASFISDRLSFDDQHDPDFTALVESIKASGQQVPVLVRPHPEKPGRFQAAYGHRRLRAVLRLGLPLRAIVRNLTDAELVLAQGKENNERRNLSFIERALFAHALIKHGFERSTVQEALSLHKADMTRFLQVAEALPFQIAQAIGPAPKAGRARWMELSELLKSDAAQAKAAEEVTSDRFRGADSDARFALLFNRLALKPKSEAPATEIRDGRGRIFARLGNLSKTPRLELTAAPNGFAEFLGEELPALLERFVERQRE
ncbi:plasmid partitioning protein RepB [Pseudaminobacter soli (ex Li et al. 2025)]|uniref:Plasmid partitioning protein RepB n=1 Tax=Pseudaminobacter soli (ex Li et al. 2025) TaxID=1295366 RepID=A0A2P7RM87_9HYPH|nr:plasmid partitioning protein RepB [Mesorhizobium soli]PSJ51332.1 plasmid partitioning protein RepB [Mesorhizobium soli]